jgi:hypothetical protein
MRRVWEVLRLIGAVQRSEDGVSEGREPQETGSLCGSCSNHPCTHHGPGAYVLQTGGRHRSPVVRGSFNVESRRRVCKL